MTVKLDMEAEKVVANYAKHLDLGPGEAASKLVRMAKGRINALNRYAAKQAAGEKAEALPKKVEKKIEKKVAKKPKIKKAKKVEKTEALN